MKVQEFVQLINDGLRVRALREPDPEAFTRQAQARILKTVKRMETLPPEQAQQEFTDVLKDLGLIQRPEQVN